MPATTDTQILLKDYTPSPYAVATVLMEVDIRPDESKIITQLALSPRQGTEIGTPLRLDGEALELLSIAIDGAPLTLDQYEIDTESLTIFSPPDRSFVLETEVALRPEKNTTLMGLYRSNGIWCTQCEAEGFRRITYFLDRPDVLATYRVRLTAAKVDAPVLLANGNLVESGELADGRHFAVWDDPHPKPSYLFAMVAGNLGHISESFKTMSGRSVDLAIYCEHGKEEQCHYAMDALKRSMVWDEQRFGREYDLDVFNIVAVSDFNFGAMENKGLNIFNDRYVLANPETATDTDFANIERVIAHEYFHNWTGNRITCRDWFQLCLKEGLTVYRDQEFTADERSRAVKRIEDVRELRMAQFPEDAGPLAHAARPDAYSEINNFYTATVYEKGAEIVRMLATLLGPDDFKKGLDLYFERHDGEATTIEAWLKTFEDATGRDLAQFGKWYSQAGTPEVEVTEAWDEDAKALTLTLAQSTKPTPGQSEKHDLVIPLRFGLIGPNGNPASWQNVVGDGVSDDMIVLDQSASTIRFEGLASKPVVSLLREFSAPVKLRDHTSLENKLFLARHDDDPFNRWQSLQDVALTEMVDAVRNGGVPKDPSVREQLAAALSDTLSVPALDDAFKAQALSLPQEAEVAQAIGQDIDPALIHSVRRALLAHLGTAMAEQLAKAYEDLAKMSTPYSIAALPTAARALRNRCLALLAATGAVTELERAEIHYRNADNMTDRLAALGVLVLNWGEDAKALLDDFKAEYASDPLAYDKWLSLSASAPDDDCLNRIKAIYADPAFPRGNPNRLRSLLGAFSMGNAVQFSRVDGSGFKFIAETCRKVDANNPQVAARILVSFRTWRQYEPERRAAAKRALDSLQAGGPLSRDVSDILSRTLKE